MIELANTHSSLNALGDVQEKKSPTWVVVNVHGPEWAPSPFREDFTVMQIILARALISFCSTQSVQVLANSVQTWCVSHLSDTSDVDMFPLFSDV